MLPVTAACPGQTRPDPARPGRDWKAIRSRSVTGRRPPSCAPLPNAACSTLPPSRTPFSAPCRSGSSPRVDVDRGRVEGWRRVEEGGGGWRRVEEGGGGHQPPADPSQLHCQRQARKLLRCLPNGSRPPLEMPPQPQPLLLLLFYSSVTAVYWFSAGEEWQARGPASGVESRLEPTALETLKAQHSTPTRFRPSTPNDAGLECQRCSILVPPREVVDSATELS